MSMFTLTISCLAIPNLPCFVDLTFQDPVQYCSLQHWTLRSPRDTSTAGVLFPLWPSCFILSGAISNCPCSFPSSVIGHLPDCVTSSCLFILFMGFSGQESFHGLPFASAVDHFLSELLTVAHLSRGALYGRTHNFTVIQVPSLWQGCDLGRVVNSVRCFFWVCWDDRVFFWLSFCFCGVLHWLISMR